MWILKGALGGLSLGMYTMWNTYKEIELHNDHLNQTCLEHLLEVKHIAKMKHFFN